MLSIRKTKFENIDYEMYENISRSNKYGINLHPNWLKAYKTKWNVVDEHLFLELFDDSDNSIKGILPLFIQQTRETRFFKLNRLLPVGYKPTDFFPIIVETGYEDDFSILMVRWLKNNSRLWDKVFLNYIPKNSSSWRSLVDQLRKNKFNVKVDDSREFLSLDTNYNYDDYLNTLGTKKVAKIRYKKNKVERRVGEIRFKKIENNIIDYFEEFMVLYSGRRKMTNQSDPFERNTNHKLFFEEIINTFEPKGLVRLSILEVDGNNIAYLISLIHNGVLYYLLPAFNPKFQKWSPGLIFLNELVKDAFEDKSINEFNFMRSVYDYKLWWNPRREKYVEISIDNNISYKNMLHKIIISLRNIKNSFAKKFYKIKNLLI